MSATLGFDIGDVRIAEQLLTGVGQHANEGIVARVQHQSRHRYAFEHLGGSGASVVILSVDKSEMARGNPIVEIAQAAQSPQMAEFKMSEKENGFALDPPAQAPKELHFVNAIGAVVQCIGGRGEVHRRRNPDRSYDL